MQDRVLSALRAPCEVDTEDHPGLAERVLAVVASAVSSTAVTFRDPLAATDLRVGVACVGGNVARLAAPSGGSVFTLIVPLVTSSSED